MTFHQRNNKKKQNNSAQTMSKQLLFISGQDGYNTYRIPALEVTNKGTILAFCEGRKKDTIDYGEIDLLLKRSTDNGQSWSEPIVVWHDAGNTCGNPCVVVDRISGKIFLLSTWNDGQDYEEAILKQYSLDTRRVFVLCSSDDGLNWSEPKEITAMVKKDNWTWYATGPGSGIQISRGKFKDRLIIPCDHIEADTMHHYSHIIFSDDYGETWRLGGRSPRDGVNECEAVELADDRLMLNMRSHGFRQTAVSRDGGTSWQNQKFDSGLPDSYCQASILRYKQRFPDKGNIIIFCNPGSSDERKDMTLYLSYDEAETWNVSHLIQSGPCAYSDLAILNNGDIGCLYEAGKLDYFEAVFFASIPFALLKYKSPELAAYSAGE
jgi:sialidase-1